MLPDPNTHTAWSSPKLEKRASPAGGYGMFAREYIPKDALLALWGGYVITSAERDHLPEAAEHYTIQIDGDHHLTNGLLTSDADYFNHSCDPNAGLRGQIALVARRDIQPNEEVCFDYAMSESDPTFTMDCGCGHALCRRIVTGNDWKLSELQTRYKGYFSSYIEQWINRA